MNETELALIDSFACAAMQAILAGQPNKIDIDDCDKSAYAMVACAAYYMAEAMFGERCAMLAMAQEEVDDVKNMLRQRDK